MINTVLEEIYTTGKVLDRDGTPKDAFPVSLSRNDGETLHDAVTLTNSRRTLEVGLAYGISSLHILQALQENGGGAHTAIDPYQQKWWNGIGALNVERAGLQNMFRCIIEPSYMVLPRLLGENERYDFVFIDGNHRFEFSLLDFFYADRLLQPGGHIMLHDTWMPSIRKLFSFIDTNRRGCYRLDSRFCGGSRTGIDRWHAFAKTLKTSVWDIHAARLYAAHYFHNYIVLEKIQERDPEEIDAEWNFYTSF
jgi:predicted O-methyltransferase YrrM